MGWESRGGGGRYYTRSRRVAGRVVREYVGSGPGAELEAIQDELARRDRKAAREKWQAIVEQVDLADRELARYSRETDRLMRAALLAAGYHQHDRGTWRRRNG